MKHPAQIQTRLRYYVLFCMFIPSVWASDALAQFDAGDVTVSAGGSGGALGYGLSGTVGYFPVDRVEVSLGLGYWSMEDTGLVQVTPGLRLITELGGLRPYVGIFYRRWYFSSDAYDDTHSAGGRLGTFFSGGGRALFGLGVVSERLLDCPFENDDECTSTYPEFSLALAF